MKIEKQDIKEGILWFGGFWLLSYVVLHYAVPPLAEFGADLLGRIL